jgi:hypothetical protein
MPCDNIRVGKKIFNHGWAGLTRIKLQGCAWASQAGAALSNPFASELARDYETHRLFCSAKFPVSASTPE